jgi:hypothetical protein
VTPTPSISERKRHPVFCHFPGNLFYLPLANTGRLNFSFKKYLDKNHPKYFSNEKFR